MASFWGPQNTPDPMKVQTPSRVHGSKILSGHFKTVVLLGWHHLVMRPQAMKNTLAMLLIYNKRMLPSSMGFISSLMGCYKVIFQHCLCEFQLWIFQGRKVQSCTKIHKAVQTLLTLLSKTLISASTKALDLRAATRRFFLMVGSKRFPNWYSTGMSMVHSKWIITPI